MKKGEFICGVLKGGVTKVWALHFTGNFLKARMHDN
jgi:hypothetical protein